MATQHDQLVTTVREEIINAVLQALDKIDDPGQRERLEQAIKEFERPPAPKVITVRLSVQTHAQLLDAAHKRRMSLNALCVAILREAMEQMGEAT